MQEEFQLVDLSEAFEHLIFPVAQPSHQWFKIGTHCSKQLRGLAAVRLQKGVARELCEDEDAE
jgi:hypothetical protein